MTRISIEDGAPVTKADLEEWGGSFEHDLERRLFKWALGVVGTVGFFLLAFTWRASAWSIALENRTEWLQRRIDTIDQDGSRGLRRLEVRVDSLRWEMQMLPDRVVNEMEARGKMHVR